MYEVSYDVYVHIRGCMEMPEKPENPIDIVDYVFPCGWDGEIDDVTTYPRFPTEGYIDVIDLDGEDEEDDEEGS